MLPRFGKLCTQKYQKYQIEYPTSSPPKSWLIKQKTYDGHQTPTVRVRLQFLTPGTQYEMKVMEYEKNIHQASCFDQKGIGQGNVHDRCFYYWFTTNLDATFEVENQKHRITAFSGLHHGFLTEGGDRINMNWTALIPIN